MSCATTTGATALRQTSSAQIFRPKPEATQWFLWLPPSGGRIKQPPTGPEYTAPANRALMVCTSLLRRSIPLAFGLAFTLFPVSAQRAARGTDPPTFQVDPFWPRPLPHHWILGSVTGVSVDAQDHIWLVHRGMDSLTARTEAGLATTPPTAESCCAPAPPVLEFDATGALLNSWGGPGEGYDWPHTPAGITVDAKGNVWIAGIFQAPAAIGGARPPSDAHILKFTRDGKFLLQIGQPGKIEGSFSQTTLNRPAGFAIDNSAHEVYVADGIDNRRVVVFDSESGAYKR